MKKYIPANTRYDTMPYRRCGKSGLLLPEISLGLWHNFGHVDNLEAAKQILHTAFDRGITHFDLANNYG
ncbi:MAG: aldo/keto reductase, partial [Bacteroidia bacterium]|nr:aldo/keto reductase [Bacteroidia bacterium]